jgi:hypothetical protein
MERSARRWLLVLVTVSVVGCGGDDKDNTGDNTGGNNTGNGTGNNTNGGDDAGNSGNTGDRVQVTDAENCAEDDPVTPGIDCKGFVACGGDQASPHACPVATHSCCASDFPSEETVNCFEGRSACTPDETHTPCDGPEDCDTPGDVCCVKIGPPATTVCTAATACDGGFTLCHTADDCPPGGTCDAFSRAAFWSFCG